MQLSRMLRLLSIALCLAGCSATVSDLGELTEDNEFCAPGGNSSQLRDLTLDLVGMDAHVTNFFEATVVNERSGVLSSRIVYDPLLLVTQQISVENAVPPGTYFLDFYADLDGDRVYTNHPDDHSWRRQVCADGSLTFVHNIMFETLDRGERRIGGNLVMNFTEIPLEVREAGTQGSIEARVIARLSEGVSQTVGVYRYTNLVERRVLELPSSVSIALEGILDAGTEHTIYYYFDLNGDGVASRADGDIICMRDEIPTSAGLTLDLDMTVETANGLCGLETMPGPDDPIPGI